MQLTLNSSAILLCTQPVDFRKSINGLIDVIIASLNHDPRKGIFIFYNRHQTHLKILAWHQNGFVLLLKRLEKKKFFNSKEGEAVFITPAQLSWLLAGLDWVTMAQFGELNYQDYH
jgi:transposase